MTDLSGTTVARYMGPAPERVSTRTGAVVAKDMTSLIGKTVAAEPKIIKVREGVHCFVGGSLVIRTIIEAPEGLVIYDTGDDIEDGERALVAIRQISDKPIKAVIYSHNHYAHGTRPIIEGQGDVMIIGHPSVNQNFEVLSAGFATGGTFPEAAPVLASRFMLQFGSYLPADGPDSRFLGGIPKISEKGTVLANRLVAHDGETFDVAGLKMQFFTKYFSDSEDTLSVWIPELGVALNNFVWPTLPNFYTLRGDVFRTPHEWMAGVRVLRDLGATYLVNTHALPVVGKEEVQGTLERYMDAISFLIDQTMRGINKGLGPRELREFVRLPDVLRDEPHNAEIYGEFNYFPSHIYNHIFGWFDGDAANIHRLPPQEEARRIVRGFGGAAVVERQAREALEQNDEVLWSLQLINWLLSADPEGADVQALRLLKARALREMAYRASGTIARHFCLAQALELEGKLQIPTAILPSVQDVLAAEPGRFVSFQRVRLDPAKAGNQQVTLRIVIEDKGQAFALAVRHGVAEFREGESAIAGKADAELRLSHQSWAEIYTGKTTVAAALQSGAAKADDNAKVKAFFAMFDPAVAA
ncbi:alkyl sulfatase dimerization domain-containing protein [Variovorax sp. J22R133]|uniref:alkyl sulfatase dimerization domain-containing protein n=1 Tax=Variovorax brevis TaxID=3053503 RepID=UPI0025779359|nr:alkyl sulfatase dimerization domain-containing protein [Variovorax sp. J22R133]MDM0114792.1 alkyl sulfatase dimerization domain-containing protein [Variovorax sp. J22R133]